MSIFCSLLFFNVLQTNFSVIKQFWINFLTCKMTQNPKNLLINSETGEVFINCNVVHIIIIIWIWIIKTYIWFNLVIINFMKMFAFILIKMLTLKNVIILLLFGSMNPFNTAFMHQHLNGWIKHFLITLL